MSSDQGPESPFIIMGHFYADAARIFARRVGMSSSRLELLHELMHASEISQAELAQRLDMEGALLTRFLKQMEADGLVTRRVDPKDNRYTLVSISPSSAALIQEMDRLGDEYEAALLEGLSDAERASLVRMLKHIQNNLARMTE